jgi:steroid 5-alpha reductase family enzyme
VSNTASILSILACLALGTIMALAGSPGSTTFNGLPSFALAASIGFILHWLIFIPSYIYQTEHYFDLIGSISYISIVLFTFLALNNLDVRSILIGLLIMVWAVRLGSFLFIRVKRDGKDNRFTVMKTKFWWFLFTWTIGGLWVFITMAAGLAAMTSAKVVPLGWFALIGIFLWLEGFLVEVVADHQKTRFRSKKENQGRFINEGLWSFSRHPNYYGEITLWLGIAFIAFPVLQGWQKLTLISPIFVYILLTRISGITMLERRADKKWRDDPEYQRYKETTSSLIPMFKRKNKEKK